jgi:hypothetical protein
MVNASASRPPVLLQIIAYEFASVLHHCALRVVATPSESFLRMWQSLVVGQFKSCRRLGLNTLDLPLLGACQTTQREMSNASECPCVCTGLRRHCHARERCPRKLSTGALIQKGLPKRNLCFRVTGGRVR